MRWLFLVFVVPACILGAPHKDSLRLSSPSRGQLAEAGVPPSFMRRSKNSNSQSVTDWDLLSPPDKQIPSPRWGAPSAVGDDHVITVLSGARPQPGENHEAYTLNDVFQLEGLMFSDSAKWINYTMPPAFTPRYDHSLACVKDSSDASSGCILGAYGGRDKAGVRLGDLWMRKDGSSEGASLGRWVQATNMGAYPANGLAGHTAVGLSTVEGMLVYGGQLTDSDSDTFSSTIFLVRLFSANNTAVWSSLAPATEASPVARTLHSAVVLSDNGGDPHDEMLVFGGCRTQFQPANRYPGAACEPEDALSDLWQLSIMSSSRVEWMKLDDGADTPGVQRAAHSATLVRSPKGADDDGHLVMLISGGQGMMLRSNKVAGDEITNEWYWSISLKRWVQAGGQNCALPNAAACNLGDDSLKMYGCNSAYKPVLQGSHTSSGALFFGAASSYQKYPFIGQSFQVSPWEVQLTTQQGEMCDATASCKVDPDAPNGAVCLCFDDTLQSSAGCPDEGADFQWYLMYSAFGAIVLFLAFLARHLHTCCRRRGAQSPLRRPLNPPAVGGGVEVWTKAQLEEFIGSEAPICVTSLAQCAICMDDSAGLIARPCRHTVCEVCACKIFGIHLECPFCRGVIEGAQRLEVSEDGADPDDVCMGTGTKEEPTSCAMEHPDEDSLGEVQLPNTANSTEARSAGYTSMAPDEDDTEEALQHARQESSAPVGRDGYARLDTAD